MDIYLFAMEMERDGKAHYLKLAESSESRQLKRIFTLLAEEEQKHADVLLAMSQRNRAVIESEGLADAGRVFQELIAETLEVPATDTEEAYRKALQLEDNSITYYRERAAEEKDEAARVLFLKLYFEEKKHRRLLEDLLEFLTEPLFQPRSAEQDRPI